MMLDAKISLVHIMSMANFKAFLYRNLWRTAKVKEVQQLNNIYIKVIGIVQVL